MVGWLSGCVKGLPYNLSKIRADPYYYRRPVCLQLMVVYLHAKLVVVMGSGRFKQWESLSHDLQSNGFKVKSLAEFAHEDGPFH